MSEKDEIKGMIKDALLELHEEGVIHIGCPWKGTEPEIVTLVKTMPPGAIRMLKITFGGVAGVGKAVGYAFVAGFLVAVLALVVFGIKVLYGIGSAFHLGE